MMTSRERAAAWVSENFGSEAVTGDGNYAYRVDAMASLLGEVDADVTKRSADVVRALIADLHPDTDPGLAVVIKKVLAHAVKKIEAAQGTNPRPRVDWSAMTGQEVWKAIFSAPQVAGPWETGESGEMDARRALDGQIVATTLFVMPKYPEASWRVPVATSDRGGADRILREHGWKLAGDSK
jgi:hypothetical protein